MINNSILRTILDIFMSQAIRSCSAGAPVSGSGDRARIRKVIANAGRNLILCDGYCGCSIVLVSHRGLR